MKLHVEVTAQDIANGKRCNLRECPIAYALERAGLKTARVYNFRVVPNPTGVVGIPLPFKATAFIADFDRGLPTKPFSFELDVPEEIMMHNERRNEPVDELPPETPGDETPEETEE